MRQDVQMVLQKEVDRRDFLKHVGLTLLALTGVAATARTLSGFGTKSQTSGFGAGVYGGPRSR